jgi:hypothetical protein
MSLVHKFRKYYLYIKNQLNPKEIINIGNFWCDAHFNYIVDSQKTIDPIDYHIATIGVSRFITLMTDYEVEGPLQNACERVPEEILQGIFARSKGWL